MGSVIEPVPEKAPAVVITAPEVIDDGSTL